MTKMGVRDTKKIITKRKSQNFKIVKCSHIIMNKRKNTYELRENKVVRKISL